MTDIKSAEFGNQKENTSTGKTSPFTGLVKQNISSISPIVTDTIQKDLKASLDKRVTNGDFTLNTVKWIGGLLFSTAVFTKDFLLNNPTCAKFAFVACGITMIGMGITIGYMALTNNNLKKEVDEFKTNLKTKAQLMIEMEQLQDKKTKIEQKKLKAVDNLKTIKLENKNGNLDKIQKDLEDEIKQLEDQSKQIKQEKLKIKEDLKKLEITELEAAGLQEQDLEHIKALVEQENKQEQINEKLESVTTRISRNEQVTYNELEDLIKQIESEPFKNEKRYREICEELRSIKENQKTMPQPQIHEEPRIIPQNQTQENPKDTTQSSKKSSWLSRLFWWR